MNGTGSGHFQDLKEFWFDLQMKQKKKKSYKVWWMMNRVSSDVAQQIPTNASVPNCEIAWCLYETFPLLGEVGFLRLILVDGLKFLIVVVKLLFSDLIDFSLRHDSFIDHALCICIWHGSVIEKLHQTVIKRRCVLTFYHELIYT